MTATLDWLARLIAHPTVSADTNVALVAELRAALVAQGAWVETFPNASGEKLALLARLGPDVPGGLMLSGHVDVVPVAGQGWTVPAFEMTRRDGRAYGRGTTDMKGFVASVMALVERLDTATLTKPLWIAISYDEEIGCVGVRPMLSEIAARGIRPDLVLVGEPTSLALGLGHKGKVGYRATCHGQARHSAEAPWAVNAMHLACDLVGGLRDLQAELEASGVREDGYSIPYSTVHAGVLHAGTAVNVVPSKAELVFETRFPAAEDAGALARRVADMVARVAAAYPGGGIDCATLMDYPGLAAEQEGEAIQRLAGCLPDPAAIAYLSFGTEAGLFAEALSVPAVVCGPGDMAQGHQPDEFIEEAQLDLCDQMLTRATAAFCQA